MDRVLPEPTSPLALFCRDLILRLEEPYKSTDLPASEKVLERDLLWATVDAMEKPEGIDIRRHPWKQGEFKRRWADVKARHCADVYGMRHAADMYILMPPSQGISVDVKLAKMRKNRMPNAELQTLIGQCFLSKLRHDFAIGILGHYKPLHEAKWQRDTQAVGKALARNNIFLVFKSLSRLAAHYPCQAPELPGLRS